MDDPMMMSSWSWDLSERWTSLRRRLAGSGDTPEQVDRPRRPAATSTHTSQQIFFVYDLQKCMSDASDPLDAIIYFYPPQTDAVEKCHLCLQLVGMAHFFTETFNIPEIVTTTSRKYALRKLESYILVLGGARDLHTYILQQQMEFLLNMFKFYHKDVNTLKEACLTHQHFLRSQKEFWQCSLPLSRCFEDKLSRMFRALTVLKLPENASSIYAKGYKLLETFQEHSTVLAGSIFYKNKILSSQLTPELTQLVQLAAVTNSRFALQDAELYNNLPPGTQLVRVYLPRHALTKLAEINAQSQSRESGLHKYRQDEKSSSESIASYLCKPGTSFDTPTDSGHRTEGKSGCECVCTPSLLLLPQSSEESQENTFRTTTMGRQGTVDSDFISDFDSERDLKMKTERPFLSPHVSELKRLTDECLRITEERMQQQQLKKRMRHKRRKVPRKSVSMQVSSHVQNVDTNLNVCKKVANNRTETHFDTNPFTLILEEREGLTFMCQDLSVHYSRLQNSANSLETSINSMEWKNVSRIGSVLSKLKDFGLAVMNVRPRDVRTSPHSSTFVSITDGEFEVKMADEVLTDSSGDLPPIVPFQLLAMTDEPAASSSAHDVKRIHETSVSTLHKPSSRTVLSDAGDSKKLRSSRVRASVSQQFIGSELGDDDVCQLLLYVQKHCQMVCVALLEHDGSADEALVATLWSTALNQLGGMEAEIRGCKQNQRDSERSEDPTLLFNKQLRSFGDVPSTAWCGRPSRARTLGTLHGDMSTNSNLHRISVRHSQEWIEGTHGEVQETYKLTADTGAPPFLSPDQLRSHLNIY